MMKENGVTITKAEAEEFALFKREKQLKKIKADIRKCALEISGSYENAKRLLLKAKTLGVSSVKLRPAYLLLAKECLKSSPVLIDCIVGGTGDTVEKVKVYETKIAYKNGARELSLAVNDELLLQDNFALLKREVKGVKRAFRGGTIKFYTSLMDKTALFRLGKLAAATGVWFISVPYADGLATLQDELHGACFVEFRGVEDTLLYKDLIDRGASRIASKSIEKIYEEMVAKLPSLSSEEGAFSQPFKSCRSLPPSAIIPNILFGENKR